jgi:hypothetical protein
MKGLAAMGIMSAGLLVLSANAFAQKGTPFTGTRMFCGPAKGQLVQVAIREDRRAQFKYVWGAGHKPKTVSGKLDEKWRVGYRRGEHPGILYVKSPTEVEVDGGQDSFTAKLCKQKK